MANSYTMDLNRKRILITRPRAQAEEFARALSSEGAEPVFFPVIEIASLDDFSALDHALRKLDGYDWLILTSIHGAQAVFARMRALGIKSLPVHLRVAAVGPKTAARLSQEKVAVDHVPAKYTADALLSGLWDVTGKRFLLPQSDLARRTLAESIRAAGGIPDEIVAYRTVPARPKSAVMDAIRAGMDVVTFASPSSVNSFLAALGEYGLDARSLPGNPRIACIGPQTASAAMGAGLPVHVEAQEHTLAGLVAALKNA
ncbi:MAG: uroporphyrinogen-III synthase [Gammaproteobacteria bacterium]